MVRVRITTEPFLHNFTFLDESSASLLIGNALATINKNDRASCEISHVSSNYSSLTVTAAARRPTVEST